MLDFIKKTFSEFSEDRCTTLGASLAFYTIFSLPPLLFILVTIVSWGLSMTQAGDAEQRAQEVIQQQASGIIGNESASSMIQTILENRKNDQGTWWKTAISIVGILIGATGVVAAIQDSLNRVWEVKADPKTGGGWWAIVIKRLLSLSMILGLGFILLVSLLLTAIFTTLGDKMLGAVGISAGVGQAVNYVMQFIIIVVVFGALFRFMPDAIIRWRDVFVGALVTAVLFMVGQFVLHWYLSSSDPSDQLGSAAGSLAVVLIWVYYSSLIFLYGAEVTQVYAQKYGEGVQPEPNAVHFEETIKRRGDATA